MLSIVPITIKGARIFVERHHRHNKAPQGGLFAAAVEDDGFLCGVAIVGRPIARNNDDGFSCEVTRVATLGVKNACSILYGACSRAAKALGYRRIITYTLENETGASLKAAGFSPVSYVKPCESWSSKSRPRYQKNLFGDDQRPTCGKVRWEKLFY